MRKKGGAEAWFLLPEALMPSCFFFSYQRSDIVVGLRVERSPRCRDDSADCTTRIGAGSIVRDDQV
jgi:hypothetical protein